MAFYSQRHISLRVSSAASLAQRSKARDARRYDLRITMMSPRPFLNGQQCQFLYRHMHIARFKMLTGKFLIDVIPSLYRKLD